MHQGTTRKEHPTIIGGRHRERKPVGRRLRRILVFVAIFGGIPFLPRLLVTSREPPASAQAIYVFPGQVPDRAECGAALYRRGVAPTVVFSGNQVAPELRALGQPLDDASLNARIAREAGVPADAEVLLHDGSSTWEDARALGEWMRSSGARTVVAVTSPTHARRAQYTLWMALGSLGDDVHVSPCGTVYGPTWWAHERSLVRVTVETLKFGFYALRYFLPAALGLEPKAPATRGAP